MEVAVDLDILTYVGGGMQRTRVETGSYLSSSAVSAATARVVGQSNRAGLASTPLRIPVVRWLRESSTRTWLTIGEVTDTWDHLQVILTRVVATNLSANFVGAGTPQVLTTLPPYTGLVTPAVLVGSGEYVGSGSPHTVVSADVGATYWDRDATNGAVRWTKMFGTSNTGWRVTTGDTGLLPIATWDATGTMTSGAIENPGDWAPSGIGNTWASAGGLWIRRINSQVEFRIEALKAMKLSPSAAIYSLPAGFKPLNIERQLVDVFTPQALSALTMSTTSVGRASGASIAADQYIMNVTLRGSTDNTTWPAAFS